MTRAHLTPWPLAARDLPERGPRPGFALPAAMLMTTLDDSHTIVPTFWHGGLACTQGWLRYDGIRPPAAGWRVLPEGNWELSTELDNEPWAAPLTSTYRLSPAAAASPSGAAHASPARGELDAYAAALAQELARLTEPPTFQTDAPVVIAGPHDLISVHVPFDGTTVRILEHPPLETPTGSDRARRARVLRDDAPVSWEGCLYWTEDDGKASPRYWPDGTHPALDAPETRGPLLDLLADALSASHRR